ncbi:uncharacterized protein LOC119306645 [Triticum dicoccoides]|uniref:uncharacterized protein LOC119306645 n=1 Tax=Triticum dicoccoides TaxID=85692 RepID=UPI00188DDA9A|nr:uncharacterized protein LOC119306645 [Triticum dicoccoides]
MAMHPRVALLLTLVLLLATGDGILTVGTPSAIITRTCAAVGRPGGQLGYEYESCVGALSSDPARELAVVATSLTVANVTSTLLVVKDLVKNLGGCLRYYREMNRTLDAALGDLRAGRVEAASDKLLEANQDPDKCDLLLFEGSANKNPLGKENIYADWLSQLAYAIASLPAPKPLL